MSGLESKRITRSNLCMFGIFIWYPFLIKLILIRWLLSVTSKFLIALNQFQNGLGTSIERCWMSFCSYLSPYYLFLYVMWCQIKIQPVFYDVHGEIFIIITSLNDILNKIILGLYYLLILFWKNSIVTMMQRLLYFLGKRFV